MNCSARDAPSRSPFPCTDHAQWSRPQKYMQTRSSDKPHGDLISGRKKGPKTGLLFRQFVPRDRSESRRRFRRCIPSPPCTDTEPTWRLSLFNRISLSLSSIESQREILSKAVDQSPWMLDYQVDNHGPRSRMCTPCGELTSCVGR